MPSFNPDILPELTRERIPALAEESGLRAEPLAQDGSDRSYYRLTLPGGSPSGLVVMHFGTDRAENLSFAPITLFLSSIGVACPRLDALDEQRHLLWLEDLGVRDLASLSSEPWDSVRRPQYEATLREVAKIHAITPERLADIDTTLTRNLQPPFDTDLYRWEQDYFFENFAAHFSAATPAAIAAIRRDPALANLISELASLPRTLVHRDFQSRNVLLHQDRAVLIDYQGMRFGRPEYDIASLLWDPYAELTLPQISELLAHAHLLAPSQPTFEQFNDIFLKCSAQRLMQALGAYGFLGIVKEKPHFLDSIGPGVQSLRSVIDQLPSLEFLLPILELKS